MWTSPQQFMTDLTRRWHNVQGSRKMHTGTQPPTSTRHGQTVNGFPAQQETITSQKAPKPAISSVMTITPGTTAMPAMQIQEPQTVQDSPPMHPGTQQAPSRKHGAEVPGPPP